MRFGVNSWLENSSACLLICSHHLLIRPALCKQEHLARSISPTQSECVALGELGESGAVIEEFRCSGYADFSQVDTVETSCIFEGHPCVFLGFLLFLQPCDSETIYASIWPQRRRSHLPYCTYPYPYPYQTS